MFHLRRNPPSQSEKPRSRPRSLSTRSSSSSTAASAAANLHLLPRRAPLAPLDPQSTSTNASLTALDDQMSPASSSSAFLGYNPADDSRDPDRARYNIGRQIIPRVPPDEFGGNLPPSSRRRSIPNQSQSSTTVSRPPQLQQRPLPRRATHTPSSSITSSRRTSLPTILHHSATKTAPSPPTTTTTINNNHDNANFLTASDDIYSNLSTFTFGAARASSSSRRAEHISPFTVSGPNGADRTPRQSLSGPSNGSRTPRDHPSGGGKGHEDEEEAARQNRAKMRAIDDGTRRPSLPTNAHSAPASTPSSPPRPETDSEAELDSAAYDDGEELDTDVEFDYRNFSREDVSDAVSHHTFGGGSIEPHSPSQSTGDARMSMALSVVEHHEEDEHMDVGTSSPVLFARIRDSSGESSSSPISSPPNSRRGSVPWNIAVGPPPVRDREDSEATILAGRRMSRGLDELHVSSSTSSSQATTQPISHSDWRSLEAQVQAQAQIQGQLQEEQRGQPGEQQENQPPEASASDAYEGFNLQYVLGDPLRRSWSSGAPSYIAPGGSDSRRGSIAPWENNSISSGRRSSTTTMSDDAFTSQLRKLDKGYTRRHEEWSFRKETADGPGRPSSVTSRSGRPAIQELWRHEYVGRFRVDKSWTEHPNKAPTQRINVRHIVDPFSRGNTRGGPHSIIHRHSRAVAFSIFRKYGIFGHSAQRPGGTSFHVHTSGTILLAPMDVQTQFTSTRTTSQLNTYGHLTEANMRLADKDAAARERAKEKGRERSKEKDKEKTKEKGKDKEKEKEKRKSGQKRLTLPGGRSDQSQTASLGSTSSSMTHRATDDDGSSKRHNSEPPSSPIPNSPTLQGSAFSAIATTSYAPSITTTTAVSLRESVDTRSPASSFDVTMSPSIIRMPLHEDYMELDDDDERKHVPRTSHAEAFATLDSGRIEYIRGRTEHHTDHDHAGGGLIDRLTRRIRGQNARVASGKPAGPSPDVPFTSTAPPWVTLAPRSKQEERERVIQNLSESFKDVGLLPTFKTGRAERTAKPKQPMKNLAGVNVFEEVPPDALHMLLPLWPGATDDPSTVPGDEPGKYVVPVEERQYLIVYYVPFDERKKDKKKGDASKKRSRADSLSAATAAVPKSKGIPKHAFRVCARLVGCHDFLGTGVRLPTEGLSITGSMAEAMEQLPPASIRDKHPGDVVIGVCSGRDRDVEFIPEGLASVGLCLAIQQHDPPQPPSPVHEEEMMDAFDPVYSLTPIGRAAVEMAWLGCLAITFSDVNPPSTK
ncbi:hypothetical protein PYCCODRAFT_1359570 [Trametes coccinea BRFM310]|uniref:Uncharacterized protein n=1 Tax=Trametes coccinea (strain BRFM310) TaxID=1353009 RepID=A0A1Y2J050_TRAC3|nr:hypothetical protein PYCCODRAFT_1359570 [Trametes coccinea BRFM310]